MFNKTAKPYIARVITVLAVMFLLFALLGARLYYVIFEWESYKDAPLDVFKIWEGGLAIYGRNKYKS